MRRLHLVELEDLPWFPSAVRDAGTGYLQAMLDASDPYAPIVPLLADALRRSGAVRIVDLCSGGGGPWRRLRGALAAEGVRLPVLLTDRYPNAGALEAVADRGDGSGAGPIAQHPAPVDATRVPESLGGFRTMFSAFHHFAPHTARRILGDAVARREPLAVFEATTRSVACLSFVLLAPLITLLVMPIVRPRRWTNFLFTYLIPIVPLMVLWDGVVSCLRTYDVPELHALARAADPEGTYDWQAGEVYRRGPIPVTYLIGVPRAATTT